MDGWMDHPKDHKKHIPMKFDFDFWSFNSISKICFESDAYEISAIFFQPQCVKQRIDLMLKLKAVVMGGTGWQAIILEVQLNWLYIASL